MTRRQKSISGPHNFFIPPSKDFSFFLKKLLVKTHSQLTVYKKHGSRSLQYIYITIYSFSKSSYMNKKHETYVTQPAVTMYCLNSDFVHSHYLCEKIKMYFLHREISILEIQRRVFQVKKCMKKQYKSSTLKSIHACNILLWLKLINLRCPGLLLFSLVCNKCTYLYSPFHTLFMFL